MKWTEEQLLAIEKENTNIIVSAGAGSGKTAVLSSRVIRKLKEGVNINELLILTFTEAAAKEMKNRIRKKIKEEKLYDQLDLVDSAFITTFDSYALSIVKKYYYLLNISKNIKIETSNIISIKKEDFLNDIFEELYQEKNEKFEELINLFTTKDDKQIRKEIIQLSNKLNNLINRDEYLKNYINNNFSDFKIKQDINEFVNLLIKKIRLIEEYIYDLSFYVDGEYINKFKDNFLSLLDSKTYLDIKNNIDLKIPRLPNNSLEEAKSIKEKISSLKKEIVGMCIYENDEEIYNSIISTKKYIEIIIYIITELNKKVDEYKKVNELYEFIDIEFLAINILRENQKVRNEIKNNLNEIMIDEYQDTNDIQEEFISFISNNNVYMVGDIKQSIYRFRNANPYIFKNKYDKYNKLNNGCKIDLNKNFRSRKEVLNGINEIFSLTMSDEIGGADYINSHKMIFGNNLYEEIGQTKENNDLEIYNYEFDKESGFKKEEYEAFIIAKDIKEKIENNYMVYDDNLGKTRKIKYNDFVILMDRARDFDLYKKIFEYFNIPLTILKDESLQKENLLFIIKNLINLVIKINENELDIDYKHSLVSILRSPLFEYSDEEIFQIFINNRFNSNELYNELKNIEYDNITTKELINVLIDKFNIYEKIIKMGNVSKNNIILEYLINKSNDLGLLGYTIKDFKNYLDEILEKNFDITFSLNTDDSDSVKIMTIHKSKGLEYSVCYFPGLSNSFNKQELNDLFLFDNNYGIVSPYYNKKINNTIYKCLVKENYNIEEISEKLRLFYVALTRAKEKIILVTDLTKDINQNRDDFNIVKEDVRLKYNSFNDILLSIKENISKYIKNIEIDLSHDYDKKRLFNLEIEKDNKKIDVKELIKNLETIDNKSFSKNNVILNTKEEIENMKFGTYMHYLLEILDLKNKNIEIIPIEYQKNINKFINLDIFKNIKNANIYKEYEFMEEKDNILYHGIIDLMVEYDEYIDIIDYKLKNIDDDNYLNQLNGYKNYIENKFNKKTNIYLYSIIDNNIVKK